jgi:hypothetical protein
MIVEDGRENGRDGRVDGLAVDYVNTQTLGQLEGSTQQAA